MIRIALLIVKAVILIFFFIYFNYFIILFAHGVCGLWCMGFATEGVWGCNLGCIGVATRVYGRGDT